MLWLNIHYLPLIGMRSNDVDAFQFNAVGMIGRGFINLPLSGKSLTASARRSTHRGSGRLRDPSLGLMTTPGVASPNTLLTLRITLWRLLPIGRHFRTGRRIRSRCARASGVPGLPVGRMYLHYLMYLMCI